MLIVFQIKLHFTLVIKPLWVGVGVGVGGVGGQLAACDEPTVNWVIH